MDNYGRSRKLSQKTRMIPAIICITMIMAVLLEWHLGAVWIHFFVTQFSSLITHHLKYHVCLAPSLTSHHSIFFTLFVGPIPVTSAAFSFFFFSTQTHWTQWKKKTKPEQTELVKKRKKKNRTANPRKKKTHYWVNKRWSKVAAVDPLCVFNYNIVIELWVMETENTFGNWKHPKCVFSFHNS